MIAKYLRGNDSDRWYSLRNPSWPAIESAIRQMDGSKRSEVFITPDEDAFPERYLAIRRDKSGYYACGVFDDHGGEYLLTNPSAPGECNVALSAASGSKTLRWQQRTDLEAVLRVAKTYAESGGMDKRFHWKSFA